MKKELRLMKKQMIVEYPTKEFMFIAENGQEFFDETLCRKYEESLKSKDDSIYKEFEKEYDRISEEVNTRLKYNSIPLKFEKDDYTFRGIFIVNSLEDITDFIYYNFSSELSNYDPLPEKPLIEFRHDNDSGIGVLSGQWNTLYTEFPTEYPAVMLYGTSYGSDECHGYSHILPLSKYKEEFIELLNRVEELKEYVK